MIFTTLLCAGVIAIPQNGNVLRDKLMEAPSRKPLFGQFFPKPTGKNGLEFYFKALDLAESDSRIQKLSLRTKASAFEPGMSEQMAALDRVSKLLAEGAKRSVDLTPMMPKANNAVDLAMETVDIFPVGSRFKMITKATVNAANARFASKQSGKATDDLLRLLEVSHDLTPQSLIMSLIGNAVDAIVFAGFNENLDRLTKRDISAILATTGKLGSVAPYQRALRTEIDSATRVLKSILHELEKDAKKSYDGEDADVRQMIETYRKATPAQKAAYPAAITKALHKLYDPLIASLTGPEHTWKFTSPDATSTTKWSANAFADRLVDTMSSSTLGTTAPIAKVRTQMRLLRLHAFIQRFRLAQGRLPTSLAELKLPKQETYDPLANRAFVYVNNVYKYKLASAGIPLTGEIELKYRRQR